MGLLNNLESRLDKIVNGGFSKAFKAEVEPVELASALQQEIDRRSTEVNGQHVIPNIFVIDLSSPDTKRLAPYFTGMRKELITIVNDYSRDQRYTLTAPAFIDFQEDGGLDVGVFRINSEVGVKDVAAIPPTGFTAQNPVVTQAPMIPQMQVREVPKLVSITGETFDLTNSVTNIGRSNDAQIQFDDSSISRMHCAIILGSAVLIRDLGSTNGTLVNGVKVSETTLTDGAIIQIGNITLTYRSR